ncbi:AAA family ATPase [Streptomyces beijiangensis]|uniref:AAA family ATPase n=1 Tax=Streptomyces beijiangensis TaxID=163361 RepID=A0A939FAN7_9ACTN|nr:AAA family ATPase [Streptomyces beijiangensis]MBO0514799.1 AAA family ATPase [Streptomyces beijiangensis]
MTQKKTPARPAGPTLKTRKPTGIVPWPLILIEGEEGSGKTYSAAQFSASEKIGQMYWLDLDEGSADEYATLPGAQYEIIEHDGTYQEVLEQIQAVHAEAQRAAAEGEPPVVLTIDSGSALWRMLTAWTHERAARTDSNKRKLDRDPDAMIDVGMHLWNDANKRWDEVLYLLKTLSGIVVVIARGKQVTAIGDDGKPLKEHGKVVKEWRVAAQKDLGYDSTVWVRMTRDEAPQIIKARSLKLAVRPGKPMSVPDFSIESLVFEGLGCSAESQPRQMPQLSGDRVKPWMLRVAACANKEQLADLWRETKPEQSGLTKQEAATIQAAITHRLVEIETPTADLGDSLSDDPAAKLRAAAQAKAEESAAA